MCDNTLLDKLFDSQFLEYMAKIKEWSAAFDEEAMVISPERLDVLYDNVSVEVEKAKQEEMYI